MNRRRATKRRSIRRKKQGRKSMKRCKASRKTQGGVQKLYVTIQPSALGLREDREWNQNGTKYTDKHNVTKLVSKVFIDNETGIDIDERIAEMVEGIKNSDELLKPIHGKMLTATIT